MKYLCCIFIIAQLLSSCKKDILEKDVKFQGTWISDAICWDYLYIHSDGSGEYFKKDGGECGARESESDDRIMAGDNAIRIANRKFFIVTPPTYIDTITIEFPLDGKIHYCNYYMELRKTIWYGGRHTYRFYKVGGVK